MKKVLAWILALGVLLSFAACSTQTAQPTPTPTATPEAAPAIQTVAFLLPGELGDKGILDSAAAALEQLQAEDRLQLTTISLDTDAAAQDDWGNRVAEIAESAAYDCIICPPALQDALLWAAGQQPEQHFVLLDGDGDLQLPQNVANLHFRSNELGYLLGVYAAAMTQSGAARTNEAAVLGFIGGRDCTAVNEYLLGYIQGAQSVQPAVRIDTRYTNDYENSAIAEEYGSMMITNYGCDMILASAGAAGSGAAQAAATQGLGWYLGTESDQEQLLSTDYAACTLTSGVKDAGAALRALFTALEKGQTPWGTTLSFGLAEDSISLVQDKNFASVTPEDVLQRLDAAEEGIRKGEIHVDSAAENPDLVAQLREASRP